MATPTPQPRPDGGVHHTAPRRRAAVGREFRIRRTTSRSRCRTTRGPTTSTSAPSGRTTATCSGSRTPARGSTTSTTRWCGTARCGWMTRRAPRPRPHGAVALELGADLQRRRLHQVRAAHAAHRLRLVRIWSNDEPLQPFTINATLPQFALPRATAEAEAQRVLDQPEPRLASGGPTGDSARALRRYDYDNQTPHTSHPRVHQLRHVGEGLVDRRPRAITHTIERRSMPTRRGAGYTRFALTAGYTLQRQRARLPHLREHRRARAPSDGRCGGSQWLDVPGPLRVCRPHWFRAERGAARPQIGEQPALRHYDIANRTRNRFTGQVDIVPNELWIFSASARPRHGRLRRQLFRLAGVDVPHVLAFGPTTAGQTASAPALSYNYERYSGLSTVAVREPGAGKRSAARLDDRLDRTRELLFDLRAPSADRREHRGASVLRLQLRAREATSTGSSRAGRCRRLPSCRRSTTSCSSCTSTSGTG